MSLFSSIEALVAQLKLDMSSQRVDWSKDEFAEIRAKLEGVYIPDSDGAQESATEVCIPRRR